MSLPHSGESSESQDTGSATGPPEAPLAVILSLGDLLNLDLTPPTTTTAAPVPASGMQMGAVDLLGGGLDSLVGFRLIFLCFYIWGNSSIVSSLNGVVSS